MAPALASFPAGNAIAFGLPRELADRGLRLRHARDEDLGWLLDLYASTRDAELAAVPWTPTQKAQFLQQQFAAQHRHFLGHYPAADFLVLTAEAGPVGRLYWWRAPDDAGGARDLIVDIAVFPAWRGAGLGTALLRAAQAQAAARGRGLELHVLASNTAARRLYERLGFVLEAGGSSHLRMGWSDAASVR